MNPSASGWIDKLLQLINLDEFANTSEQDYYGALRTSGFIYGTNASDVFQFESDIDHTEEEITKINLLLALLYQYFQSIDKGNKEDGIRSILNYFDTLGARKFSFLDKVLVGKQPSSQLEKILHNRIQANKNIFTKNFSNIITNALLFIDVLTYKQYLDGHLDVSLYAERLEQVITNVVLDALNSKDQKTDYDELLVKLVESSLRFHERATDTSNTNYVHLLKGYTTLCERTYIFDLACMAVWDDKKLDAKEEHYIWKLRDELSLSEGEAAIAVTSAIQFIENNKDKISFFNHSNPVKHFYDQSSKTVSVLILRNRRRLVKELKQSQELLALLGKSAGKTLTEEEKQKVKEQLLDICKTIPSLAIFALPGGAVLLPILIKFIPKLLPSAFDENRVER
ncbi:LETM1-related biofilm-associated protein [Spongiivirga citrea]|uniref:Letm1 RBD domain-containing protein n=1 Tax=Spongiivirga citrea TaxID=1481457 RepID=A0A6M0CDA3_9FLAO|nr:LETM1-related biofilm-associated protein [Spongiivirga citrea]NER15691.1 hypothetical protein [Spongiivirga citrea]